VQQGFFAAERSYNRERERRNGMPRRNQYSASPIIPGSERRPPPPAELEARERAIWTKIIARLPAIWITAEAQPMLTELCRHIRIADDLSVDLTEARAAINAIRKSPEPDSEALAMATQEYLALLRAHGFQSERIGNLSTKLRLTPQARYAPSTANRATSRTLERPWEDWGEDRPHRKQ
jgi:hypothetical protein